ncbi:hypothetical protein EG68_09784 [Paragonimus skrjabini miyazakii]|uniref:Uncharacterized protein n=1 Tax=Paragonimus skrjabini miyazakii TaxID=59628 RepID=A0A8S9YPC0_9TREM|nr:hypothetical protein EG68_09784 [Paragonimus skrjabini miyazakii]
MFEEAIEHRVMRYDDEYKRVVIEPVELSQEFRKFEFDHAWETFPAFRDPKAGEQTKLLKDEKTPIADEVPKIKAK